MPTEVKERPSTAQTGSGPNPISSNAQDFSDSDDEIVDNFAEGPQPGDPPPTDDTHDDGTPLGLGGEKGKQSEPASSTLEADIVNGATPNKPGDEPEDSGETAPEDSASEPESGQDAGEADSEVIPESDSEPETPELPPVLLQMAGYDNAEAAKADGLGTADALNAYIRGRGQLLTPDAESPYRPKETPVSEPEKVDQPESVKAFELPADKLELLDEDVREALSGVLSSMNEHYQSQFSAMQVSESKRLEAAERQQAELAQQRELAEISEFDDAVQKLGDTWKDTFGEGSGTDLDRNGQRDPVAETQFNHRSRLFDAVQAVREVNKARGFKPMNLNQEIQFALMQRYPDQFQKSISGNSSEKVSRAGVTASRPTQRKTPATNKDKLLNDLHKKYPKAGFDAKDDDFDGEI